jgi:hypothetical protein
MVVMNPAAKRLHAPEDQEVSLPVFNNGPGPAGPSSKAFCQRMFPPASVLMIQAYRLFP